MANTEEEGIYAEPKVPWVVYRVVPYGYFRERNGRKTSWITSRFRKIAPVKLLRWNNDNTVDG